MPDNPSAALIETLREAPGVLPADTEFRLLEVGYREVAPALKAILADPPAALVLTGYSGTAQGLRLETRAHDHRSPDSADALGELPGRGGGAARAYLDQAGAELPALAAQLAQAGIAGVLSDDCGAYVCNHLYYQALRRIAERGAVTRAVFVHVPAIEGSALAAKSAGAMPLAIMARGVALIAASLAGANLDRAAVAGEPQPARG